MLMFPIIYKVNDEIKLNNKNLKKFSELIMIYEQMVKVFLDDHNLGTPTFEEDNEL